MISEIFLQPRVLALKQRVVALGVCKIRKNTHCGYGWVFFPLLWEFSFVKAKLNTF